MQLNTVEVEEREPTHAELELLATKQLMIELSSLKQYIYKTGMVVNGMLIVQLRMVINGLLRKYNEAGVLIGETVVVRLKDKKSKHASIFFEYSDNLKHLVAQIGASAIHQQATEQ